MLIDKPDPHAVEPSLEGAAHPACAFQSHPWVAMEVETKFLRLFKPGSIGDRIDGSRVCWIVGWDKCRVMFVVTLEKAAAHPSAEAPR